MSMVRKIPVCWRHLAFWETSSLSVSYIVEFMQHGDWLVCLVFETLRSQGMRLHCQPGLSSRVLQALRTRLERTLKMAEEGRARSRSRGREAAESETPDMPKGAPGVPEEAQGMPEGTPGDMAAVPGMPEGTPGDMAAVPGMPEGNSG